MDIQSKNGSWLVTQGDQTYELSKQKYPTPGMALARVSREQPGLAETIIRKGGQGALMGWSEPAAALLDAYVARPARNLVRGVKGMEQLPELTFDEALRTRQAQQDKMSAARPVTSAVSEIGGAILSPANIGAGRLLAAGAKALPTASRTAKVATAVPAAGLLGAGEGAIYGAGTSAPGERLEGAQEGALWGAAGGVAGAGAGATIGAGINRLRGRPYRSKAGQELNRVLEAEEMTPADVTRRLDELGEEAAIADVAAGTRGLTEDVANTTSRMRETAEEALRPRQEGAVNRVLEALRRATGGEGDAWKARKDIEAAKIGAAGKPLQEAREAGLTLTPQVRILLGRPAIRDAWPVAQRMAANEGKDLPELFVEAEGGRLVPNKELLGLDLFDALDYVRKALNQRASALYDPQARAAMSASGKTADLADLNSLESLARRYRDALKDQNTPYRKYLELYADEFANERAMKLGRRLWRSQGKEGLLDEVIDRMSDMSDTERAYLRDGVVQSLVDALETGVLTGSRARDIYKTKRMRDILRRITGSKAAAEALEAALDAEIAKSATYTRVTGGSPTAARTGGAGTLGDEARSVGAALVRHDYGQAASTTARAIAKRLGKMSAEDKAELMEMLLTTDPREQVRLLRALEGQRLAAKPLAPPVGYGAGAGGLLGGAMTE